MFEERQSVPVWFMRQAGRYQKSYRDLKEKYSFEEFCKKPELAAMLTMNALEEFHFDAGIVFSDLLFPLESIGCDLLYNPGPIVKENSFKMCSEDFFSFQEEAIRLVSRTKPLLGFIGGPYTLYSYLNKNVEDLYSDKYKEFTYGWGLTESKSYVEMKYDYNYVANSPLIQFQKDNYIRENKRTRQFINIVHRLGIKSAYQQGLYLTNEFVARMRARR